MEEKRVYTREEQEAIAKEIYDGLLTVPTAAAKCGVDYYVARRWYREYRASHRLPPKSSGFASAASRSSKSAPGLYW